MKFGLKIIDIELNFIEQACPACLIHFSYST